MESRRLLDVIALLRVKDRILTFAVPRGYQSLLPRSRISLSPSFFENAKPPRSSNLAGWNILQCAVDPNRPAGYAVDSQATRRAGAYYHLRERC
jgi:hypothetical protein